MANATSPNVSWVSEPDGRGTVGLLWSCVVTIFLCTWSAIHPNVPERSKSATRLFWKRLAYVCIVILMPELMVMVAVTELCNARLLRLKTPGWKLRQCFFLSMGGFILQTHTDDDDDTPSFVYVKPETFVELIDQNVIDWPSTTDAEIDDRSKADWVMKTVTMSQVIYFVAQVIGRVVQRLPVSALELYTLSIVLSAAFMYIAWWKKPYDVHMPIVVPTDLPLPKATERMKDMTLMTLESKTTTPAKCFLVILFAVGAIQLGGWNFHFPTVIELWLWRSSGMGMMVCACVLALSLTWGTRDNLSCMDVMLMAILIFLRLFAFVEMFVGLREVPKGVYKTPQWSQYLPSIGG